VRVLVVDDDEWVADSTQPLLESLGYRVEQAVTGPEALDRFRPGAYEFVLLDYRLPGMNGVEVLRELLLRDREVRVILCTGMPRSLVDLEGVAEDAFAFLEKPWTLPELIAQIVATGASAPTLER
jgi:CheY-like chemotaxis protein